MSTDSLTDTNLLPQTSLLHYPLYPPPRLLSTRSLLPRLLTLIVQLVNPMMISPRRLREHGNIRTLREHHSPM